MFQRGTLWELVERATRNALQSGVLQPIATQSDWLPDGEVRFLVRRMSAGARKPPAKGQPGAAFSPFLEREDDLFVADLSATHSCRLNRYPVVDHHLLIVTREYEEQDAPLNRDDFHALWTCLREYDALGFYNGGGGAGASQMHKHLQVVPLPLAPSGPRIPLEPLIVGQGLAEGVGRSPGLPFRHAVAPLPADLTSDPARAAAQTETLYREMLQAVGLDPASPRLGAYNLLASREWMLLVPRRRERFETISLNALAFAGALLVKNLEQWAALQRRGPLAALREVVEDNS